MTLPTLLTETAGYKLITLVRGRYGWNGPAYVHWFAEGAQPVVSLNPDGGYHTLSVKTWPAVPEDRVNYVWNPQFGGHDPEELEYSYWTHSQYFPQDLTPPVGLPANCAASCVFRSPEVAFQLYSPQSYWFGPWTNPAGIYFRYHSWMDLEAGAVLEPNTEYVASFFLYRRPNERVEYTVTAAGEAKAHLSNAEPGNVYLNILEGYGIDGPVLVGDKLKDDASDEIVLVLYNRADYTYGEEPLIVARGYGGTTLTSHAAGATWRLQRDLYSECHLEWLGGNVTTVTDSFVPVYEGVTDHATFTRHAALVVTPEDAEGDPFTGARFNVAFETTGLDGQDAWITGFMFEPAATANAVPNSMAAVDLSGWDTEEDIERVEGTPVSEEVVKYRTMYGDDVVDPAPSGGTEWVTRYHLDGTKLPRPAKTAFRGNMTEANGYGVYFCQDKTALPFGLQPGDEAYWQACVSPAFSFYIEMKWYDADGEYTGSTELAHDATIPESNVDGWAKYCGALEVPAGASVFSMVLSTARSDSGTAYMTLAALFASYADGDTPGWLWSSTAHDSVSEQA